MAILRRGPFRTLRQLERQLDDLVPGGDDDQDNPGANGSLSRWNPRADVYEDESDLVFELDTPGVNKDDLEVNLEDNRLIIQGERREEKEIQEEDRNYLRSERVYGTFQRSFRLPENVEADEITANFDDGVLRVRVPATERTSSQSIQIQ